jgi:putative hemolysin
MTLFTYADPAMPALQRGLVLAIERVTGKPRLERMYREYRETGPGREDFFRAAIRKLALNVRHDPQQLAQLPATGPVVVVANHPYGVLDGIALGWLVGQVRSDFLILAHSLLSRAEEARPYLLPIDFTGTPDATATNLRSRDMARRHLAAGGAVLVFPAGAVSTSPDRLGRRAAVDATWQPFVAQLIQRQKAPVLPIHFGGQNSRLFQMASHVSQTLRLSLLFKEVNDRIGTDLEVSIGDLIPYETLARFGDRKALMAELRRITESLAPEAPRARPRPLVLRLKPRGPGLRRFARRRRLPLS